MMPDGRIIYLNGTSNAGKTSLALALQDLLNVPYLHFSIDVFDKMVSRRQIERGVFPNIVALEWAFTRCIVALVTSGNNVIVDDVLSEPWEVSADQHITTRDLLYQRVTLLSAFEVCYVKVFCPLEELGCRERARGTVTGLARFQFDRVHQDSRYDVEVDTSMESPEACARRVLHALTCLSKPHSFSVMRAMFEAS